MRWLLTIGWSAYRRTRRTLEALEEILLPPIRTPREPTNADYRRIVIFVAIPAIGLFLPSLPLAGVPQALWVTFTLISLGAAAWISASFLFVPRSAVLLAGLAAGSNALIVGGLALVLRDYYHEIALLYVLLVAGHAVVHGLLPSLVLVSMGPLIVPLALQDPGAANPTDAIYSGLYLGGTALIAWGAWRLAQRRADQLVSLRRSSETERSRLAAILGSMGDAVLAVDQAGGVVMTNEAYDRVFASEGRQIRPDDERGKRLPRSRWPQVRAAHGESFSTSFTLRSGDGERRWFEATGAPIASGDGEAGGVVVVRDITDRSLRRLQEEFMATASHELRTPVAALHGYLQLLQRHVDPAGDGTQADYTKNALAQTRRLGRLLDRLLDLARLQTGGLDVDLIAVDLVAIVRRSVDSAQALTADQEIHLKAGTEPLRVLGDPARLEQVVLNLLTNAITHAPESKRIDVRVGREAGKAEVEVRDYGPGIPQTELARLFSRFGRASYPDGGRGRGGLGLGLYISRELMRAHKGTIQLTSTVGVGTNATIRLPLVASTRSRTPSGRRDTPVIAEEPPAPSEPR